MSSAPDTGSADDATLTRPTREPVDLLLRDLRTAVDGLSPREAAKRLTVYGANTLPHLRGTSWLTDLAHQFTHPLALLLWAAAGLALLAETPALCWAILGVIVVNAGVAFAQERQAARAVDALAGYLPPHARVVRASALVVVPATDVVPGDVLLLVEGDRVCADARLISGDLEVDMSP